MRRLLFRRELAGTREGEAVANRLALVILGGVMLLWLPFLVFPGLEGRLNPVVADLEVFNVRAASGGVMFSARAEKRRPDCNWRKTVWYLGERGGGNVFLSSNPHRDPPKVRGGSALEWGEIYLPIAPDRLGETFADVTHICGGWRTVQTRFWR